MSNLVSIIVPVYNAELFLAETINSVLPQSYSNWELILVNDGSEDSSGDIISEFEKSDHRISSLTQENLGVAKARNYGYQESKGEFIIFLDSDDVWNTDHIEKQIAKISVTDFGLVHSDGRIIDADSKETDGVLQGKEGELLNDILLWNGKSISGPSGTIIRRAILEDVGLFDERLSTSADQDLFIRISSKYIIGRVSEFTWKYRIHPNNMHKGIKKMEEDVLLTFNKAYQNNIMGRDIRRKSFGITFRVLGASWVGDGGSLMRGLRFFIKSILIYPEGIFYMLTKGIRKIFRNS